MSLNKALRYPNRWGAPTAEYPMGVPKNRTSDTAKDGTYFEKDWLSEYEAFFGALMNEAGFSPNGDVDTAEASQFFDSLVNLKQVAPLNNDYNGYMDPDHQSSLPSDAGYPGGSGSPTTYALDDEISLGIYSGIAGNSVSSDADGWVFSGSIYKEYTLTAEQIALIDVNSVNVFVKDEAGVSYFWKNGDTGVTVSKSTSTTLRVTLDAAIFGVITKLWRFFVTEKVGYVGELSADTVEKYFQVASGSLGASGYYITSDKINGKPVIFQMGIKNNPGGNVGTHTYPIPFPNAVISVSASDVQTTTLTDGNDAVAVNIYLRSTSVFDAVLSANGSSSNAFSYIAIGY